MNHGSFATTINCMDGRTQLPVNNFLKETFHVDFVDTITEPGPDKILAENTEISIIDNIKKRVLISTEKHGSKTVAIIAHYDCTANPVDEQTHLKQLKESYNNVISWNLPDVNIITLWVDENWQVHQI